MAVFWGTSTNNVIKGTLVGAVADSINGLGGSDTLYGLYGDDTLNGGDGSDKLFGGFGTDQLNGGNQNDTLTGGHGADEINGDGGVDTVSYALSDMKTGVVINLALGAGDEGDATGDTYSSIENVLGSAFDDEIVGNSLSNRLDGNFGNDTLFDGAGNDFVYGGFGSDYIVATQGDTDTYDGGANTADWLDVSSWNSAVNVNLTTLRMINTDATVGSTAKTDKIFGFEYVSATDHNDTLIGSAYSDKFLANDGADTIRTMAGYDIVDVGFMDGDVDTLQYLVADVHNATFGALGHDKIYSFTVGEDVIDISALLAGQTLGDPLVDLAGLEAAVSVTSSGGSTTITSRYTTANTTEVKVAVLLGVSTSLADLVTNGSIDWTV